MTCMAWECGAQGWVRCMTRVHIAGCVYMDHGGFSEPLGSVCGRVCGERGADAETPSMGEGGSIPVFFERGLTVDSLNT